MAMGRALEILELSQDMGFVTASQDRTVIVRKMISKVSLSAVLIVIFFSVYIMCTYRTVYTCGQVNKSYLWSESANTKLVRNWHLDTCYGARKFPEWVIYSLG